ncbi:hypothetical protein NMG60_11004093 [Bertholletia excelsa]
MEEDGEEQTPFWLQSSTNPHRRRRASSLFLNSGAFVFLLCVIAVLFIFFVVPSIVSFTTHIFRPSLVKKSWDSLNIILVLFALLFGFLSRNTNHEYDSGLNGDHRNVSNARNYDQKSTPPSTSYQWYEYPDRTAYSSSAVGALRTSSSYPDLREVSPWVRVDDRWRFSDDTRVDSYWVSDSDSDRLRRRPSWKRVEEDQTKTIHVDTLVTCSKEVLHSHPPAPLALREPNTTYESVAETEKRIEQVANVSEQEPKKSQKSPSLPSPPSLHQPPYPVPVPDSGHWKPKQAIESVAPRAKRKVANESEPTKLLMSPSPSPESPSQPATIYSEKTGSKSDRKRGSSSATKDFLTSLYHQSKKKKKQRAKSVENFETLLQSQPPPTKKKQRRKSVDNFETFFQLQYPPISPPQPKSQHPPPPPPPPPPSVLHNLFSSKKGKSKKIVSIPPPPPPPPIKASHASRTMRGPARSGARETPLPVKTSSFNSTEDNYNSGGNSPLAGCESPLIPIPPPPPPPPFKMPGWKFVVQGDYVRVDSMNSSRSGSPDLDDVDSPRSEVSTDGEGVAPPLFCPSPDVDTKADMFIAKFRAGLKLQKNNSIRQRQGLRFLN